MKLTREALEFWECTGINYLIEWLFHYLYLVYLRSSQRLRVYAIQGFLSAPGLSFTDKGLTINAAHQIRVISFFFFKKKNADH